MATANVLPPIRNNVQLPPMENAISQQYGRQDMMAPSDRLGKEEKPTGGVSAYLDYEMDQMSDLDRKSTRLNSSHVSISYAVSSHLPPHLHPCPTRRSSDPDAHPQRAAPRPEQRPAPADGERDLAAVRSTRHDGALGPTGEGGKAHWRCLRLFGLRDGPDVRLRSEEHTSELQSRFDLVCRLLPSPTAPPPVPYTTLFRSRCPPPTCCPPSGTTSSSRRWRTRSRSSTVDKT